ncbi:DUF3309 domain-containing protein [Paraburkholderia sp. RP-4-7]|uniref:DUF3309 domain-containing protein n=1 Tax=Paraburkholderia polaris TaxID=2728848 RepID=A0A848IVF9_9BURK|nr:DUF3309 family protein [Paraburkholderia polaris]NMM03017.1 DUF3309 domain-containing protein [Paraburkholderia polaris]
MLAILLISVLGFGLLGAIPAWRYSRSWGYMPSGLLGILMLTVLLMLVLQRL